MDPSTDGGADMLIILAPNQGTFYDFVKARQEAGASRTRVILDRRRSERRNDGQRVSAERRHRERRATPPEAARALMSVLGFMVLHRDGDRWVP